MQIAAPYSVIFGKGNICLDKKINCTAMKSLIYSYKNKVCVKRSYRKSKSAKLGDYHVISAAGHEIGIAAKISSY